MIERLPTLPDLTQHLRQLIDQVPAGRVTTCGDLADALGNRIAATWIGHYSLHHDHGADCPCHRIVRAGGELGGYAGGSIDTKIAKLTDEGVVVVNQAVDLSRFRFCAFVGERPLEQLRQVQQDIQRRILIQSQPQMPQFVAGVDVAYPQAGVGVAAYALVETASRAMVWSTTVQRKINFPYISSYLSFRELPILLDLLDHVRSAGRMAEVLMVDGSGILHQRHAGIASHLGVVAELPTIGVTKKLLCGQVDIEAMTPGESRAVLLDNQPVGVAIRPTAGSSRPIFVSPGHRVDLSFCERVVRQLLAGHRLPEPVYWADRLSRK